MIKTTNIQRDIITSLEDNNIFIVLFMMNLWDNIVPYRIEKIIKYLITLK